MVAGGGGAVVEGGGGGGAVVKGGGGDGFGEGVRAGLKEGLGGNERALSLGGEEEDEEEVQGAWLSSVRYL